jgi:Ca-activated chloride channel homolog
VVVFDGVVAPRLPAGNFLLLNTVAPGLPFSDAGRVEQPDILGRGASALMREVDLSAVRIDQARRVVIDKPLAGLQRLFWSRETDLALALLDDQLRLVYLGFDLVQSNFPLQAAFPLFISQSLDWLRPHGDGFVPTHIAAGSTHSISLPVSETRVNMRTPAGNTETLAAKGGSLLFDATADAGIYRYTVGGLARSFAVTLADARESDVNNRRVDNMRNGGIRPASNNAQALAPLWPYLLALVLLLLALEWWVWTGSRNSA